MSFLTVMRDALHVGEAVAPTVAPVVATAINPAAGALVSVILESVAKAEEAGGTGAAKKQQVLQDMVPAGTAMINAVMHARGINLSVNASELSTALDDLVDGFVGLLNALEAVGASAPSATAPPATSGGAPVAPAR